MRAGTWATVMRAGWHSDGSIDPCISDESRDGKVIGAGMEQ